MCGLAGVFGDLHSDDKTVFKQLMYTAYLRGNAAAGVSGIRYTGDVATIWKATWPVLEVVEHPRFDSAVSVTDDLWLGHTRQPTVGLNIKTNAQPFGDCGRLIGTHNGTITSRKALLDDYNSFGTDSEALYENIAKHGVKKVITEKMITNDPMCAYALVWYDRDAKTLNMLRNDERPLHFAYSEDRKQLYWASEFGQLAWVLSRNGKGKLKIYEMNPHMHFAWPQRKPGEAIAEPTRTRLEPREERKVSVSSYTATGGTTTTPPFSDTATAHGTNKYNATPLKRITGNYVNGSGYTPVAKVDHISLTWNDWKRKGPKWRPPYIAHDGAHMNKDQVFNAWSASTCMICDGVNLTDDVPAGTVSDWGSFALFFRPQANGKPAWVCESCCTSEQNIIAARAVG